MILIGKQIPLWYSFFELHILFPVAFLFIFICDALFEKQGKSSYLFFLRERSRIDSKCSWLLSKRKEELLNNNIKNIRPIRYYQKTVSDVDHGRDGMLKGSVNVRLLYPNVQNSNVELEKYRLILSPFFHLFFLLHLSHKGNSWLVRDLSIVSIPLNIQNFLQLGDNFALPLNRLD